jgi:hypothetical protein
MMARGKGHHLFIIFLLIFFTQEDNKKKPNPDFYIRYRNRVRQAVIVPLCLVGGVGAARPQAIAATPPSPQFPRPSLPSIHLYQSGPQSWPLWPSSLEGRPSYPFISSALVHLNHSCYLKSVEL